MNGFISNLLGRPQLLAVLAMVTVAAISLQLKTGTSEAVDNPPFPQSCQLSIVLVLDSSGSIDATELAQMKDAMQAFVGAYLAGNSEFAVVDFDQNASVITTPGSGNFITDETDIAARIDAPTSGPNATNWEQGLAQANGILGGASFDTLVVFASDGNPNNAGVPGTNVGEASALAAAVVQADLIKTAGAHITGVAIGGGVGDEEELELANIQLLTDDVIDSDFDTLEDDLLEQLTAVCGGRLTLVKEVINDGDGEAAIEDFDLFADDIQFVSGVEQSVAPGTYELSESGPGGYAASGWDCVTTQDGDAEMPTASSVVVEAGLPVICTIVNDDTEGGNPGDPGGPVRLCVDGKSVTVSQSEAAQLLNDDDLDVSRGSCPPSEPPPGPTVAPTPVPTPVITQEVEGIVEQPIAEVESIVPPTTGDGGLASATTRDSKWTIAGLAVLINLGVIGLAMRSR